MNILKKFAVFAAFAAAMTVAGCSDQDQSSLSIEDFQGRAKISGTVSYNEGQAYNNGKYTELNKVAANTPVYIRISNSSLLPNGNASGYTTLETVTDANGKYEIEVPLPDQGARIYLHAPSFTGTRTLLKSWENGSPVFEKQEVVFEMASTSLSVVPNDIVFENLKYGFVEQENEVALVTEVPFAVKVGLGVFQNSGTPVLSYKSGTSVVIRVRYDEISEGGSVMYRNYGATTDYNGEAKFNIPAPRKDWSDVRIEIKALPFHVSTFEYSTYSSQYTIMGGTYKQYNGGQLVNDGVYTYASFTEESGAEREIKMVFVPDEGVLTYGYAWYNYNW